MVCLDLTEADNILLKYASFLCHHIPNLERVVVAHNIKFDYPEEAEQILDNLKQPLPEVLQDIIEEKVKHHLTSPNTVKLKIVIEADSSTPHVLARVARIWDSNLILVGRKGAYNGRGITPEKLLRLVKFETGLLMIPENVHFALHHILFPTDFSDNAMNALHFAQTISKHFDADIQGLHVMSIPAHYFPFIPVDHVHKALLKSADKANQKFMRLAQEKGIIAADIPTNFIFSEGKRGAEIINTEAQNQQANLIVISAHGKNNRPNLLGNVTLQLIQTNMEVPLLILRRKNGSKV